MDDSRTRIFAATQPLTGLQWARIIWNSDTSSQQQNRIFFAGISSEKITLLLKKFNATMPASSTVMTGMCG